MVSGSSQHSRTVLDHVGPHQTAARELINHSDRSLDNTSDAQTALLVLPTVLTLVNCAIYSSAYKLGMREENIL